MTIAELIRGLRSYNRRYKLRLKEKAIMDYKLADLIGISLGRIYSKQNRMPDCEDYYSTFFKEDKERIEEEKQKKRDEKSALRFKKFAQSFNKRMEVVK